MVLHTLKSGARADAILDRLEAHLAPAQRHTVRDSAVARLRCNLLPEEARTNIEQRRDRIDRHWPDCLAIRAPRATMPGRFTRPCAPQQRHTER